MDGFIDSRAFGVPWGTSCFRGLSELCMVTGRCRWGSDACFFLPGPEVAMCKCIGIEIADFEKLPLWDLPG